MNCGQVKDWLGPHLDGEVSPDVQRAVEAHVADCAACSAELKSLRHVTSLLAKPIRAPVPPELWDAIEQRLDERRPQRRLTLSSFRSVFAAAAVLVIAVGVGLFSLQWGVQRAEAATVNFGVLLDALKFDPQRAFAEFLSRYEAQEVSLERAKRHGRDLNFAIPETLPGGFKLVSTYALRFGRRPGVAARYDRNGELLGAIFHPPVLREDFGTHEDRECVVGKHRGHAVEVGEWSLIHVTDPTTCHCVLSRLDMESGLPAIMAAVAPAASETQPAGQPVSERP
ncbi:MAG: zf-HC2 domain-containing protein [Phycisphaerae bacterium]|jgi:hypothetical protein|nr:zf-HC2 domain-containing protein [Phycisphaerae bacterium]MCZ2399246.1 zf-HC2 domain-containing protein [Phycisphaerae bacterium]